MKKEKHSNSFVPKPTYPGGPKKMSAFIFKNLKYPNDAIKKQIKGTVRLKIDIDYKGRVIDVNILSGLTPSCDNEAKRVAKLLRFDIHQKLRKGKVRYAKTLNINFNPPNKTKTNSNAKLKYTLTPAQSKVNKKEQKSEGVVYRYTLNVPK